MDITISGSARTALPPELGVVHLEALQEGPDRAVVIRQVQEDAAGLVAELESLGDELEDFHVDALATWSQRADDDAPVIHTARIAVRATFRDASALAERTTAWAAGGIQVAHTSWRLTDETRRRALDGLVGEALDDARDRARRIADHLGAGELDVVHVTDTVAPMPMGRAMYAMANSAVTPRPEDIDLATELTVVFRTR